MSQTDKPVAPDASGYKQELIIDKINLLYRESGYALAASMVAGLIYAACVWEQVSLQHVTLWLIALSAATLMRLGMFLAFRRRQPKGIDVLHWYRPYVITLLGSSLIWGVGTVLVVMNASLLSQVITYVFVIALSGAAIVAYGLFLRLAILAIGCVLLPIVIFFAFSGKPVVGWLAIAGLWFFMTTLRSARIYNRRLDESFQQSHQLREAKHSAEWHAETDMLTGLKNRRAFTSAAKAVIQISMHETKVDSMLLLDIDASKEFNDSDGHAAGVSA